MHDDTMMMTTMTFLSLMNKHDRMKTQISYTRNIMIQLDVQLKDNPKCLYS